MRKIHKEAIDEMRPEYDFRGGVRGKYLARYKASTHLVVLDPDVSLAFPNAAAVNEALPVLVGIAGKGPALPSNRRQRTSARSETKLRARRSSGVLDGPWPRNG
jgi:hypothetical protein